jgi:CheY-like chemotaxis protein
MAEPLQAPAPGIRPVLLVVDDMPGVGASIRAMLGARCEVQVVTDPAEAVAALRGAAPIDALLCDVQLGGPGLPQLVRELRTLRPALAEKLLLMTGGAFPVEEPGFPEVPAARRLLKPFGREQLLGALASVGVVPGGRA